MTRLEGLMEMLPEDIDGALITSGTNRRYYTGFASSAGTVLALRDRSYFIIDSRYFEAARNTVDSCEVLLQERLYEQLGALLQKHGAKTVAVESQAVTLEDLERLNGELDVHLEEKTLSRHIRQQRRIKSAAELEAIAEAQRISDSTFTHILNFIAPGKTEREIALEMEFYSRRNGSEGAAFPLIVVSGKNSALPHGVPSDKPVAAGDFITMDFGSIVGGYCSDMTRTVAVGHVSEEQRRVYDTVLRAQLESLAAVRPGAVCREVDGIARGIIGAAGWGEYFGHGLGHSLGLEVHEEPRFNLTDQTVLEPGIVMSVEPGIYLPGRFGVRIEDIAAVTPEGHRNLVSSTKDLLIL